MCAAHSATQRASILDVFSFFFVACFIVREVLRAFFEGVLPVNFIQNHFANYIYLAFAKVLFREKCCWCGLFQQAPDEDGGKNLWIMIVYLFYKNKLSYPFSPPVLLEVPFASCIVGLGKGGENVLVLVSRLLNGIWLEQRNTQKKMFNKSSRTQYSK